MRDSHKLKDKVELSLDNTQIVSITVASLIVLGGAFMLGVVVGKKLQAEATPPAATGDLLTQLDERSKALQQLQADASDLTFQEELTKKAPTLVAGTPVVKPVELPPAARPEPTVAVAEPPPAPHVDPPPAAPKPEAVAPESETVVLAQTPKAEPVATRTWDGGALKDAFTRVQRPVEAAPAAAEAAASWAVQVAAYQDRGEADRFASGLRDRGYAPYVVEASIPGRGLWFRVRVGRFDSKDAAQHYLDDFRRETSLSAIVTNN